METTVPVEIEIAVGIQVTEINTTELLEIINEQCGIDTDGMVIGFEIDDEGYIIRIIIYVEDEATALQLVEAVNDLEKDDNCQSGILCDTKEARIITTSISSGDSVHKMMKNIIYPMIMMALSIFVTFHI